MSDQENILDLDNKTRLSADITYLMLKGAGYAAVFVLALWFIVAVIAGIMALFLSMLIPGNSYIVIASMAAAAIGVVLKKKIGAGGNS